MPLQRLRAPFHPSRVEWKPGAVANNRALALAYADPRAYMERLDEVFGGTWAVTFQPWGDRKIVCNLSLPVGPNGEPMVRSSTGESDQQSERSEIAGTAAEAQAFKRACAMFGLGRYLYDFPSTWVDYSPQDRGFTAQAKQRLDKLVWDHYSKATGDNTDPPGSVRQGAGSTKQPKVDITPEVEFQPGVGAPGSSGVFIWPTSQEDLDHVTQTRWDNLPGKGTLTRLREEHVKSVKRRMTEKQYGYLAGMLDKRYGKDSHRAILSIITGESISGENRIYPGFGVKAIIDWVKDPEQYELRLEHLDGMVKEFKEAWASEPHHE